MRSSWRLDGYRPPQGGFFLWLPVPPGIEDGVAATVKLWSETGVRVLARQLIWANETPTGNPGDPYIRVAMVAPLAETERGLKRIRDSLYR